MKRGKVAKYRVLANNNLCKTMTRKSTETTSKKKLETLEKSVDITDVTKCGHFEFICLFMALFALFVRSFVLVANFLLAVRFKMLEQI